jgi:hypothetical protein
MATGVHQPKHPQAEKAFKAAGSRKGIEMSGDGVFPNLAVCAVIGVKVEVISHP